MKCLRPFRCVPEARARVLALRAVVFYAFSVRGMASIRCCWHVKCRDFELILEGETNSLKYHNYEKEKLTLRDGLALDRTRLANERTLLAYVRAAAVIFVSSVSILKLLPNEKMLVGLSWVMLPTSVLLVSYGAVRTIRLGRSLKRLEDRSSTD